MDILDRLPPGSIDAIVTSPPYNLGVRYRSDDDTMPRNRYLEWTGEWVRRAARAMTADGSLFLNVGTKPTDPWTAIDIAQAIRPYLQLQTPFIALAVGNYKPINSRRFLHDCHEFVFHFTASGQTPVDRQAIGWPTPFWGSVPRLSPAPGWASASSASKRMKGTWARPSNAPGRC